LEEFLWKGEKSHPWPGLAKNSYILPTKC
jgi:hypothetical protein